MGTYSGLDRPIVVVDYDPNWPSLYAVESQRILAVMGAAVVQIEHIGSTAVPGLAAKPVIDIAVGIADLAQAMTYVPMLGYLGYLYVPEAEADLPERRFFWKGTPQVHTYHISMAVPGSSVWVKPIAFRDYLRGHPEAVQRYQTLKRELARRCGTDIGAYIKGKTALVESALILAGIEARNDPTSALSNGV
ncbi:MAG TPA: GrpB family protein [Aggregatilineaceae bacterium]|nr:GrpB family protein [Aggregatilineaceae bacterium]